MSGEHFALSVHLICRHDDSKNSLLVYSTNVDAIAIPDKARVRR
jgi:hypothetical protein